MIGFSKNGQVAQNRVLRGLVLTSAFASAAAAGTFDSDVKTVLANTCFACHNPKLASGGLNVQAFYDPATILSKRDAWEAIGKLREIYSGTIGYDDEHIQVDEERYWLRNAAESRQAKTASLAYMADVLKCDVRPSTSAPPRLRALAPGAARANKR